MADALTVRLPEPLNRQVWSLAKRLQLKRSDVVRLALQKFVEGFAEESLGNPFDRVKDLMGSYSSGIPDLGSRHREHLVDRIRRG